MREAVISGNRHDLVSVGGVVVDGRGVVAVSQPQLQNILVFDERGRLLRRFGRNGEGPGEFRVVSRIGLIADSLWAYDGRLRRFTIFAPDGSVARTFVIGGIRPNPRVAPALHELGSFFPAALHADGTVTGTASVVSAADWSPGHLLLARVAADGELLTVLGRVPDTSAHEDFGYFHRFADGSVRGRAFPLVARPEWTPAPAGDRIARVRVVARDRQGGTIHVDVIEPSGRALYERRFEFRGTPIPRAVLDSAIAREVRGIEATGGMMPRAWTPSALRDAAAAWQRRARQRIPPWYPPIEAGSIIGSDGAVWIPLRLYDDGRRWHVLDAHGEELARTTPLPPRATIHAATATHVWAVELDDDDVPSIVRYRIVRR